MEQAHQQEKQAHLVALSSAHSTALLETPWLTTGSNLGPGQCAACAMRF